MTSVKRTQRKYVQKAYRVRNWREYETGLRARGSLTVWLGLTDGKLANWNSPRPTRRKPGRQRKYSNHAIETTVTLGLVFGLASRQTEGFLRSLLTLLNLDNDVPDHSTISRRKAKLGKVASCERRTVKPVHLLIDSSGLSVHVGQCQGRSKSRPRWRRKSRPPSRWGGVAEGGLRTPGRLRGAGPSCCGQDDSSRRSAPGCGRDGSAGRAGRRSAVRSRRSPSIR